MAHRSMSNLRLSQPSSVVLRTFAEGLFARLAHDLEITALEAWGEGTDEPPRATLGFAVAGLRVRGAVRAGKVDDRVLSASERADIESRMQEALGVGEVTVGATLLGESGRLEVRTPRGSQSVEVAVRVSREAGGVRVQGECELSLRALGVPPVRGPAGAFRLADRVEVRFEANFEPA
jgi:hypothetical protein